MDNAFVLPADAAIPLLWKFLNRWPSAEQARKADKERIAKMLQPLGLHETRAATIIRFSGQYFLLFVHFALISSYASGSNSYLFLFYSQSTSTVISGQMLQNQHAPLACWRLCITEISAVIHCTALCCLFEA